MDYLDKLENAISDFETNSGKLSDIPVLTENVKNLVTIYKDGAEEFDNSQNRVNELNEKLESAVDELQKTLELEQQSRDELLTSIKAAMIENNKAQIEAVNSVTTLVNNKVSVAESNLTVKAREIEEKVGTVDEKVSENGTKIDNTSMDLTDTVIPAIKRTQIFAVLAVIGSIASCVIGVLI
jgi:chromosome segregation ATPase